MEPFFTRPLVGSVPISSPFDSLLLIDLKIEYSPRGGDEESRDYDDGYGNNVVESNTHRSIRACSSFIFSTEISCDLRPFRHNRRPPQEAKLGKNDGREGGEGGPILIDPWELKTDN